MNSSKNDKVMNAQMMLVLRFLENEVSKNNGAWPTGATSLDQQDNISRYVNFDIENIDDYKEFGCLFVNRDNGGQQTSDVLVPISELKQYKTCHFAYQC